MSNTHPTFSELVVEYADKTVQQTDVADFLLAAEQRQEDCEADLDLARGEVEGYREDLASLSDDLICLRRRIAGEAG